MWASSPATDSRLPASVATAMGRSRCSSASQQPDLVVSCGQGRRIKHLAEVTLPLVFPTLGDGHGFDHVGGGAPILFGRLMQVALSQILPAPSQEVAGLIHVVRNRLSVGCGQRSFSCGRAAPPDRLFIGTSCSIRYRAHASQQRNDTALRLFSSLS